MEIVRPQFDRSSSPLTPYLRLMRLPNVFTAISNVTMGFLFTHPQTLREDWQPFALLVLSSVGIYTAGMVLNDWFDIEVDRAERPFRPLPSGQISLSTAGLLGFALLFIGWLAGLAAGWWQPRNQASPWLSGGIATSLVIAVLLYNGFLKQTAVGPLGMGICRLLNVLLGMSAPVVVEGPTLYGFHVSQWLVAGGMGVYVLGITCFAKGEAGQSRLSLLLLGLLFMVGGVAMLALLPQYREVKEALIRLQPHAAMLLFAILGLTILRRAVAAITDPQPALVQATVKHALLSIIVFDAAVTVIVAGPMYGIAVACLLLPAVLLGRLVYST